MILGLYVDLGICFGVVVLIFYCAIFLNFILQWAKCYIDDTEYKCKDSLTKIFILKYMSKSEARWVQEGDKSWLILYAFKFFLMGIIAIVIWPIALAIITGIAIMKGLRSANRIKKKVSSLSKVAHKHLDEVNIEKLKE